MFGSARIKPESILVLAVFSLGTSLLIVACRPRGTEAEAQISVERPGWLSSMPDRPAWWPEVMLDFPKTNSYHEHWLTIKRLQKTIDDRVRTGISPTNERKTLIKYMLSLSEISPSIYEQRELHERVANLYHRLGDDRRSAKEYVSLIDSYSTKDPFILHALALRFEEVEEKEFAERVYVLMLRRFKSDKLSVEIAEAGVACLRGNNEPCKVPKPDWWGQVDSTPAWWNEVSVDIPSTSCLEDASEYMAHMAAAEGDARKTIKANTVLLNGSHIPVIRRTELILGIAAAYIQIGDDRRGIVTAWRILDQYSCDKLMTELALKKIAYAYDDLGDGKSAQDIRDYESSESGTLKNR
jgi:hypothetical protein